jgi:hypothetical protein
LTNCCSSKLRDKREKKSNFFGFLFFKTCIQLTKKNTHLLAKARDKTKLMYVVTKLVTKLASTDCLKTPVVTVSNEVKFAQGGDYWHHLQEVHYLKGNHCCCCRLVIIMIGPGGESQTVAQFTLFSLFFSFGRRGEEKEYRSPGSQFPLWQNE